MQLLSWDLCRVYGTLYRVKCEDGRRLTVRRIPPSVDHTPSIRARVMPVRWILVAGRRGPEPEWLRATEQLERVHAQRVLRQTPRLLFSLYERLQDIDVVRHIAQLFTTLQR